MEDVIEVTSTASLPSLASTNVTPSRWRINLSGRPLKDAYAFATALRIATKCPGLIESLCMNETSLSDTTLRHLCLGVLGSRSTVCIHRLELSGNALTDASLPPLASLLSSGCLTTALHLSQNALTGAGVESHLVPSLRQCPTLQALDLSFNPSLGDGGVGGLVECLADTPPTHALLSLDLSSTGLGVGGAWRVARSFASLGCCPRLATLNLSFNPGLGDEGMGALAAGLAVGSPPALKTLHLDGCGLGDTGMLALTAALATAPLLTLTCTANPGVTLGPTLLLLAQLLCGGGKGAVSVNWGEEAITALVPPFVAAVALVNPSSTTLDDLSAAQYLRSSFMSEGRSGGGGISSGGLIGKGGGGKLPLLLPSTTLLKSLHWEVGMIKQDFSVNGPKALSLPSPSQQQQQLGQQVEGVQQQGAPMSPPFAPQGRRRAYSFSPASPPSRSGKGGGGGGEGERGRGSSSSPLAPNQTQMHTLLTHPLSHSPPPRVTLELLSPIPHLPQQHKAHHHHQHHLLAAESLPLSPSQFIHSQLQRHQDLPPPPTSAAGATAATALPQQPTQTTSKPDIPALLAELLPIELLDTPLENLNPRQLAAVLSLAQSVSATALGAKPAAPPPPSRGGVKDKGGAAPPQPPLSPLFYEKRVQRAAAAAPPPPPHFSPQSSSSYPSTLASKMMGVMPFPSTASTASSSRSVSPTVPPPPPPMPRLPAFTPSSSSAATGHDWRENLPLPPMGEVPHQQGELPRPKRSKAKGKGGGGGGGGVTTNTPASTPAGVQQQVQAQVQALAHPVKAVAYSTLGGGGGMAVPKSMGGQEYAKVLEAFVRSQA